LRALPYRNSLKLCDRWTTLCRTLNVSSADRVDWIQSRMQNILMKFVWFVKRGAMII